MLELRFGIVDGRTRTLEEVGKEFNVTRERIRQIEAKALRRAPPPQQKQKAQRFPQLMKKFDPFFEFYSPDSSWYGIIL